MRIFKLIIVLLFTIIISGCGIYENPSEVSAMKSNIPFKDASLAENSVDKDNITAVAEIPDEGMQFKMFSEVLSYEYLPVLITVTNNSSKRVLIKNIILENGHKVLKPLPIVDVVESLKGHFWLTVRMMLVETYVMMTEKQRRDEAVTISMYNKTFRPNIINPGTTDCFTCSVFSSTFLITSLTVLVFLTSVILFSVCSFTFCMTGSAFCK